MGHAHSCVKSCHVHEEDTRVKGQSSGSNLHENRADAAFPGTWSRNKDRCAQGRDVKAGRRRTTTGTATNSPQSCHTSSGGQQQQQQQGGRGGGGSVFSESKKNVSQQQQQQQQQQQHGGSSVGVRTSAPLSYDNGGSGVARLGSDHGQSSSAGVGGKQADPQSRPTSCPGEKRPKSREDATVVRPCLSNPFSSLPWVKSKDSDKQKPYTTTVCPQNLYGNNASGSRKENRVMMNKLAKQGATVRHVRLPPPHASFPDPTQRQKFRQQSSGGKVGFSFRKDNSGDRSELDITSMGAAAFCTDAILNSPETPVELVCLDPVLHIYVCDIGLTQGQCQSIMSMAEECANEAGRYSAYTYAKQTLGCRDYDTLASSCASPTHVACQSIRFNLSEDKLKVTTSTAPDRTNEGGATPTTSQVPPRPQAGSHLVLDEREPHIVKYDTVEKTRQKLDMHTDKSEWTFLIALSEYGIEYEGGGTYFEASRTTYHLMRGQCLIFPGKLKHCGKKITRGRRFLLVGFMVKRDDVDCEEAAPPAPDSAPDASVRSRVCEPLSISDSKDGEVDLSAEPGEAQ